MGRRPYCSCWCGTSSLLITNYPHAPPEHTREGLSPQKPENLEQAMVLLDAPGAACCSSSVVASAAVPWSVPWRTNKQLAGRAVVLGDPKVLTGSSE